MKIILGSQSKGRKKVLTEMGIEFETMNPNIDEKALRFDDPRELTLALAHAKADALLDKIEGDAVLITSDQVIAWNGKILEKPENESEVRAFLDGYPKCSPQTVTAVVVVNTLTKERLEGVDIVEVVFKEIPEEVIVEIVKDGNFVHLAGGFSVDDPKLKDYILKIDGEMESVMGLPKTLTRNLIKKFV